MDRQYNWANLGQRILRALVSQGDGQMTLKKSAIIGTTAIVAVLVSLALYAQNPEKPKSSADPQKTLKVDVDLVTVNATVTDAQSRVITGLEKSHFRVWEDK